MDLRYLQEYEVNILNTNKLRPCNDESCVSSEKGCRPDNVTPVSFFKNKHESLM